MNESTYFSNPQTELALGYIQRTDRHVFLTGKAGTGKTTFLKRLKELSPKRMVVVAPTGVAAINAEGVTIHSFFSLPLNPFIPKDSRQRDEQQQHRISRMKIDIIRSLDLLVIDEISMVRADLLDAIDETLRRYRHRSDPFGGVQLLMIGDLQQLPPVVTDADGEVLQHYYNTYFFYGSHALQKTDFVTIELQHIYRQSDPRFIDLLNAVRENRLTKELSDLLHQRIVPGFRSDDYIMLTTHNAQAQQINEQRLATLKNKSYFFKAKVVDNFPESIYPTEYELELKIGARVMFLRNDSSEDKLYFNGKIGTVTSINEGIISVRCDGESRVIQVSQAEWENRQYELNETTKEIQESVTGRFIQYPLKLAWAITIHKSQGLTFDKAVIDARAAFAHGQVYVALSRCRSLDGLVLSTPVYEKSLITNADVALFTNQQLAATPTLQSLDEAGRLYVQRLVMELFDFTPLLKSISEIISRVQENEQVISGNYITVFPSMKTNLQREIVPVGEKFLIQLQNYFVQSNGELTGTIQDRIQKGSLFFLEKIKQHVDDISKDAHYETDNKAIRKTVEQSLDRFLEVMKEKKSCLHVCCKNGFDLPLYLRTRAKAPLETEEVELASKSREGKEPSAHPDLLFQLRAWRNAKAVEVGMEPYEVLRQKSLDQLVERLPVDKKSLSKIKGLGNKRLEAFGSEIAAIIADYLKEKGVALDLKEEDWKKPLLTTYEETLALFNKGLDINEIAQQRGLKPATIGTHLVRYIKSGEIDVRRLVPDEDYKKVAAYFEQTQSVTLTPAYEHFEGKIDYSTLRFVLAGMVGKE